MKEEDLVLLLFVREGVSINGDLGSKMRLSLPRRKTPRFHRAFHLPCTPFTSPPWRTPPIDSLEPTIERERPALLLARLRRSIACRQQTSALNVFAYLLHFLVQREHVECEADRSALRSMPRG